MADTYNRPRSEILATLFAFDRVCRERGIDRPTEFNRETIAEFIVANNRRLADVPGLGRLAVVFPMWMVSGRHSSQIARGVYDPQWELLDTYLARYPELETTSDRAQERTDAEYVVSQGILQKRREAAAKALEIAKIRNGKVLPPPVDAAASDIA